jgi:putative iron-only hydrogenase system regulator
VCIFEVCTFSEFPERFFFALTKGAFMDKRIGIVGIVIEELSNVDKVNNILHEYSALIIGRMGIPYRERNVSVISLIVDGSNDEISSLTGKLGRISGISVKSMITKNVDKE